MPSWHCQPWESNENNTHEERTSFTAHLLCTPLWENQLLCLVLKPTGSYFQEHLVTSGQIGPSGHPSHSSFHTGSNKAALASKYRSLTTKRYRKGFKKRHLHLNIAAALGLLRCQKKRLLKRRLVQAPQAPFKAPIHSKCCIGGFRETGLALVIVLRCD